MSRSPEQVLEELLALTPPGEALPHDAGSIWAEWLMPQSDAISTWEGAIEELLGELYPGEATILLADYVRVLGPDPYGRDQQPLTIAQQQQLAGSRWTMKYGVRPADFIAMAAALGVTITITEYTVTQAGDFAGCFLTAAPTQFTWVVNMPTAEETFATAGGSSAGDFVSEYEANATLEAFFKGRQPAHTDVVFNYS
jgi:uncharacterized protein YmfQ (DUF2313 family)